MGHVTDKKHEVSVAQYNNLTPARGILADVDWAVLVSRCAIWSLWPPTSNQEDCRLAGGAGYFYRPDLKETRLPPTLLCPEPRHMEPA